MKDPKNLCQGNAWSTIPMWNTSDFIAQNNSNSSDSDGLVAAYHWEVFTLLPIMLFGITGNILVCMAVSMEKRLQSVTNYFLLSLAITDLLVSVIVMPFSMVHQFIGYWPFNYIVCDVYVTSDVLMCTCSILHLCSISLERYLAISSPLAVRNKSKSVVIIKIVLVWILSAAITSPITILGILDHKNILNNNQCALTNEYFIIYGSTGAFFIPLGIMVITYGLTIRLLHKQSLMCGHGRDGEGQPIIRRSMSRKANKFRKRVKFETRRTQSCPDKNCKEYNEFPNRTRSVNSCPHASSTKNSPEHEIIEMTPPPSPMYSNRNEKIMEENHNGVHWRKSSITSTTCSSLSHDSPKRLKNLVSKHHLALKAASILLMRKEGPSNIPQSPRHHDQDDVNTEQRASKVLGVVFAIFIICWAPFFIVNILTVWCKSCEFSSLLITLFVWLGYVSSTLNPIIYTMFNKTFKMTFIKLLKCQYKTIQKSLRVRWHSRNGYNPTFRTQSYYMNDEKAESNL
ncbi:5-hydroxytryptamine receptor 2C-like [Mya arenaria]|uniref:5-hydroxytryptamine receptor 2C-like n=1 Tax=Mya arenaria TaxID=6604 RepID=UPI0022E3CE8F|nr:5-hydroxytryptamine receptor 2C-like [Mya arenaria]XP_052784857.1 5-hydroxytryptamine receptor 2C-like [Mya arenaria]XP_052784858.1 5-hydroxytryptamine receptor 2C-like [Mya arenaria]XP_052784859.1 5-hydroxytryptamine receptor 2C-like [Mya arenaria]XP_052784860.1 5-hydroxytryptamine receptor 2C-like [Mya arenaria]XP_052784861.1 5-hydroxytryptamine receptor 2C-like [Mya arenaria]